MKSPLRLAAALALFLSLWFLWPMELDGFAPGRDGRLSVPDYLMTNVRYVSVKDSKIEMESQSRDAAYDLATRRMDAKDVTAYFHNARDEKTELKADKAFFYMDERRMHLLDNVRSRSPDGFLMRGPEAEYKMDGRLLTAPRPVEGEMENNSMRLWGDSARSAIDERTVHLNGNARAEFQDKKRGLTKIRGETAVMDREKSQVTFRDKVRVDQDKIVGTSHVAHLFYSPQERGLRYMSLLEDVKIEEKGGRYTRSQVAEFFAPADTIVLTGFPSVYHGDDVVTGDRITLYRATGVVEVTATNAAGNPLHGEPAPKRKPVLTPEDEELIP